MALSKDFWNKYFEVYDVLNLVIPYQKLLDEVIKSLAVKSDDIILDVGCGTGNLSIKIKEEFPGVQIIGIDSSREALNRFRAKDSSAEALEADITKILPFKDNKFDKIACVNVFYALPEESRGFVLREFWRLLKKDGILVMTNPIDKNPSKIYIDHIKQEYRLNSWHKATFKIIIFIPATLKMIYYNSKIINKLSHTFLSREKQKFLLKSAGFCVKNFTSVYSDQSLEVVAVKVGTE